MIRAIVLKVDAGAYHCRAVASLSKGQREAAKEAATHGWLRLLPKRGLFPRRYVVTSSGSHAIDTFAFDTLRSERRTTARAA